jgi:multiple sugar transport system substrate-binding protein
MRMKFVWIVLLIASFLVACSPPSSPVPGDATAAPVGTTKDNSTTTVLQFAVTNTGQDRYDNLIKAFEADNPDVHISTVSIEDTLGISRPDGTWPDDGFLRLAAAADVIAAPATRQAVEQGALLDLTQFLDSDSTLKTGAFYPGLLESMQWDGKTWSVPSQATYALIYYDKTLFDAAGVAYPKPGWTWDDFLATAQALTVGSGDTVSQWGFVEPNFDPVTFVQARAGLLFNPDTYPPTARLDEAAVVQAVRWYTDLFLTYKVAPYYSTSGEGGPGGMFNNESMRLIGSGQAAMWFFGGGNIRFGFQRAGGQQQTIGVVPFPVDQAGDHTTPTTVDGFSISAGTKKADLAWKWISYLVQQQASQRGQGAGPGGFDPRQAMGMGSTLPALPSVAAAAGTWDNLDEDTANALKYATEHAYVDNYNGTGYDTFRAAVVDVMDNGAAIETALADAQTQVEADIEAEVAAAPTPVANLVVAEDEQKALNAGAVIINFGMNGGRFGEQSFSTLIDQFEAAHPDIIVETDTPEGFRGEMGLADMAAQYDCFQASPSFSDEALAAIVNLEPFLAADSSTSKEDFFPSVLQQFIYQGQVWGLPANVTANVINYNKDLFDAAKIPYPSPTWTTSDFLDAAVALTRGDGQTKQYGFVPSSFGVDNLVSMIDRLGADMLDESVDPPKLVFNSPDVMEAFRWVTSLATQYGVEPPVASEDSGGLGDSLRQSQSIINEGRAAMWMDTGGGGFRVAVVGGGGGGAFFGGPGGTSNLNIGVAPLPSGPNSAKGSGFQTVDGYFISAQTQSRQACWTWITYLTEQASAASGLPARQSVAQSADYRQRVGEDRADAYLASVSSGSRASFYQRISDEGNWLGMASAWLSNAYSQVVSGQATVEDALNAAQESVDSYRDCIITKNGFQDPAAMRQCLSDAGLSMGGGVVISAP